MHITFQKVIIDRDPTVKIPRDCAEYEVEVLRNIHGSEFVFVESEHEVDVGDLTAAEAYNQLLRQYSQHPEALHEAYRSVKALAKESGLPYSVGDETAAKAQQSVMRIGGVAQGSPVRLVPPAPAPAAAAPAQAKKTA